MKSALTWLNLNLNSVSSKLCSLVQCWFANFTREEEAVTVFRKYLLRENSLLWPVARCRVLTRGNWYWRQIRWLKFKIGLFRGYSYLLRFHVNFLDQASGPGYHVWKWRKLRTRAIKSDGLKLGPSKIGELGPFYLAQKTWPSRRWRWVVGNLGLKA